MQLPINGSNSSSKKKIIQPNQKKRSTYKNVQPTIQIQPIKNIQPIKTY